MKHARGTEQYTRKLARVVDKLLDYPRKGRHLKGGQHVKMTNAPGSPGWTRTRDEPRKHPDRDEYAYPIDGVLEAALDDTEKRKKLKKAELDDLDAAALAAVELDDTWNPPDPEQQP